MPKRPAKKVKSTVTVTKSPSPSQLRKAANHAAQLEREAHNKRINRDQTPWELRKTSRKARRKPLQEAYAKRMENESKYKSKGKSKVVTSELTKSERENNRRVVDALINDYRRDFVERVAKFAHHSTISS